VQIIVVLTSSWPSSYLAPVEVHVFYAQAHRFRDAHARSIEKPTDEEMHIP